MKTMYKTNKPHLTVRVFSDNSQRTSKRGMNTSDDTCFAYFFVLLCSYHVVTSSVRYQSTQLHPNTIYLLISNSYLLAR